MVRYYEYTAYKDKWWYIAIKQWLDTKLRQVRPFILCPFDMKLCILTNSKMLISNMTVVFFKFWRKSTIIKHFWSQTQNYFCFTLNFTYWQIRGCWFKIWQKFYQIPVQKYPNREILVPNLLFYLTWNFEDADFKNDSSFFKF